VFDILTSIVERDFFSAYPVRLVIEPFTCAVGIWIINEVIFHIFFSVYKLKTKLIESSDDVLSMKKDCQIFLFIYCYTNN